MKTLIAWTFLCLATAAPARAEETLPAKALERLKAATVYVKAVSGRDTNVGSGFVFYAQGRAAYLATNHHVVMLPGKEVTRPSQPPLRLPPRAGKVTVVFHSGTRSEREVPAAVVFRDPERDLALLKVGLDKDLPPPALLPRAERLTETTPVYVLGFPFGAKLDPGGKNPAVTVGRGAVSSLREDGAGHLSRVQIEAEVHPGNSGGPVVDAGGRLVGVTVAKVRDTRIGVVIPAAYLDELMRGRFAEVGLYPKRLSPREGAVCVNLELFDPLRRVRSAQVYWLPPDVAAGGPQVGKGGLAAVKGSREVTLSPGRSSWQGHLRLPLSGDGPVALPFQVVLSREEGGPQVTPVYTYRWAPGAKAAAPEPLAEGEWPRLAATLRLPWQELRPRRAAMARLAAAKPGAQREEVVGLVRKALGDPDVYVREGAVRALGTWAGRDGLADLVRRLKEEESAWVRWSVLEELGKLPCDEAARAVVEDLARDRASGFPAKALRAMGPAAEKEVRQLLGRPEAAVRAEACRLLGAVGTERSVPALEKAAGESDPHVAEAAQGALKAIQGRKQSAGGRASGDVCQPGCAGTATPSTTSRVTITQYRLLPHAHPVPH
jgi:S1-C subfamily serine protease